MKTAENVHVYLKNTFKYCLKKYDHYLKNLSGTPSQSYPPSSHQCFSLRFHYHSVSRNLSIKVLHAVLCNAGLGPAQVREDPQRRGTEHGPGLCSASLRVRRRPFQGSEHESRGTRAHCACSTWRHPGADQVQVIPRQSGRESGCRYFRT